ncbi:hypothetical protein [uncultured Methanobrevibacter sp.]|nr:hypothetical protein [uncultured Methanobrevibacter sp.]
MHYTGPVYRPPPEANTPLLEVTYVHGTNAHSAQCIIHKNLEYLQLNM